MKDRVGCFGDVLFGLLLAGIFAKYVGTIPHLMEHSKSGSIPSAKQMMWVSWSAYFEFASVACLWALQARVVSTLFVDHVAFIIGYVFVLFFVFGWALIEGVIPWYVDSSQFKEGWSLIVVSPTTLLSGCLALLLFLAIGGLTYHWFQLNKFERYERVRDCSIIALAAVVAGAVGGAVLPIREPQDLLTVISLLIIIRVFIAVSFDSLALKKWGDPEQRHHLSRTILAGEVIVLFFSAADSVITLTNPIINGWLLRGLPIALFILVAFPTFSQYRLVRTQQRKSDSDNSLGKMQKLEHENSRLKAIVADQQCRLDQLLQDWTSEF